MRILAVSHDDGLGAPGALINMARALSGHGCKFEFLILKKRGMLFNDFQAIGKTHSYPEPLPGNIFYRVCRRLFCFKKRQLLKKIIRQWRPSVILVNTVASSYLLGELSRFHVPIVIYVHELHTAFKGFALPYRKQFLSVPNHYIVVSKAVYNYVLDAYKLAPKKVLLAYAPIDLEQIDVLVQEPLAKEFEGLKIGFDYIVGACGSVDWRKGTDLWLHIASEVKQRMLPQKVRFVWIGAKPSLDEDGESYKTALEIDRLGLREDVFFTGIIKNPHPLYRYFDVVMMASREDPCPQAVLESLYQEKPVVCFKGCGGAPEVVGDDAGFVISNLSISTAAQKIVELLNSPVDRRRMGKIGKARVVESFDVKNIARQVLDILKDADRAGRS